jgi:hypothetical protein
MALGYCPALLRTISEVAGQNDPSLKLHNAGFLSMLQCCQNSSVNPINDAYDENGHERTLTVSYRQRPTLDMVQEEDDCDINRIPAKAEWTLPSLVHLSTSHFLSDETIRKFCEDASRTRTVGTPPTRIMMEHYGLMIESANLVMKAVNRALVTEMATQFGLNTTIGSAAGKVINIERNGNQVILDNGILDMMRDFQENEICGDPCIVGGGIFSAYNMQRAAFCCNSAGVDLSRMGIPRFFFDKDTQDLWGENTIGAFAPGSVKLIDRLKYKRSFAGPGGTSFFFTIPLPINEFNGCADPCQVTEFDVQLKYYDCPTVTTVNGQETTVPRGWQVIVSKNVALWVQPRNGYAPGDELNSTNGTLKYFITNDCTACDDPNGGAYGYGYGV